MINDELKALLIVGAVLSGASATSGFVGGRMTAPEPPAEVRIVRMPPRLVRMLPPEAVPVVEPVLPEAPAPPPIEPVPPIAEPPVIAPPVIEAPLLPPPRPKVEQPKPKPKPPLRLLPKPEKEAAAKKPRPMVHKALPSCAEVKREYDAMSWPERMAAYRKATTEEIAHGKHCLGL